jgi:hypothetical protein
MPINKLKMTMKKYFIFSLAISVFTNLNAQPYSATVTTTVLPPVNPVISQYISSGSVLSSFMYGSVGTPPADVYVQGKIECLSPTPFTISVNPNFTQAGTVTLMSGVPNQLSATQLLGAFGFFNDNNLVVTGVSLTSLKDANNNIKLPAGVYRICFVAKQVDPASGQPGSNLSDPNLGCGSFTIQNTQPANAVIINTVVIPPVVNTIASYILRGGVRPMVQYNNPGAGNAQVKIFGKIERLSPSPFVLSLNANYSQQQPVTLTPGVPLQLSPAQIMDAFGNFTDNNLTVSGISLSELKDAGNNIVLPDGRYRICFYARYIDPASGGLGNNASDPALGCGSFGVCTSAAAPQFTQPVSNFNIAGSMAKVQRNSPIIFSWTPSSSTCGGQMGAITYDFEIHEMFTGQTVTDAINNPPVFTKTQLTSSVFLLDTLLYKNVLENGKQYAIRVRANAATNAMVQKIDNNGYSRIEAFQYGDKVPVNNNPPDSNNNPPPPNNNNNQPPQVNGLAGDCGIPVPANTAIISANEILVGKDIKIGEFTLVPSQITRNNDNTYTGKGTINWNPVIGKANLIVAFDKIKINTDKVVFDGSIVTQTNPGVFKSEKFDQFSDFAKKTGTGLDKLAGDVEDLINQNAGARLLSQLNGSTPVDLPLGLNNQDIGGVPVTMAIVSIIFSPKGATMSLLFDMNVPEANGWLTLAGTGFCIHPSSISLNTGTLFLPIDRDFNIGGGQNNMNIKFKGCPAADSTKGTYVSWVNGKLSDIVAHAEISFPQNLLVPEDNNGNVAAGSVVAKLLFRFKQWEDWIATIDLPNFQLTDVKGLSFHPSAIYYDHSVNSNVTGFTYPSNAKVKKGNDFEGLYMKEFKLLLPEDFKTFNQKQGERTDFTAENLIIDDQGLSVYVKGTNVIDISTGNMGGWGFSLKNIELDIASSTFQSGKIDGQILLPVSSTPLDYTGDLHIDKGNDTLKYAFVVKPSATMIWDIWKASVELKPSSYIEIKRDAGGAAVTALLSGDVSIVLTSGTPSLKLQAITFDSLGISNRNIVTKKKEFWMSPGVWALAGMSNKKSSAFINSKENEEKLSGPKETLYNEIQDEDDDNSSSQGSVAGFPINLDHIVPFVDVSASVKAGLKLDIFMGIGGADKTVLAASTSIKVYGEAQFGINSEDYRPKFKVTGGIDVDSIKLEGAAGPVKIKGYLAFYNKDKTYGDGIKGHVEATFPMIKVEATAQFGNINNYDYWYIDACAQFDQPIPIVGVIGVKGFGGGAYSNMKLLNEPPKDNEMSPKEIANNGTPGKSMSGLQFVPDEGSFGLRATVLISLTSGAGPKAMNAKVTMGAEIKNGAFQNLNLTGDVYVFTNPPDNDKAVVNGHVEMIYDFPTQTFSMNALIQGKFATITATIPIAMHTGPDGWYFKIGDPQGDRVSIKLVDINNSVLRFYLGATAYMQMGTLINPSLPDLPPEIIAAGLNRSPSVDALIKSMNKSDGNGFMFGARVDANLRFSVAIFYAEGKAIVGLDMALKNFTDFKCGGQSAGWENWYAMGQLYAYLNLEAGVDLDVWFYKGKVKLLSITTGAVLTAGLPNPTWLDGNATFEGDVLGLIKFKADTHFTVGDKCYPNPDPLKDIQIISDYGPTGNKESVYALPYAASNLGLDKIYEIAVPPTTGNEQGEIRLFRFRIKSFQLLKNGTQPVTSTGLEYQNDNDAVILKRDKVLDGVANYTGKIVSYAEQYYENEGGWAAPWNDKENKRSDVEQTATFTFKTGTKPGYITDEAISFSYPVNKQRYVLKQELSGKGKIHLVQSDDDLLNGDGQVFNALKSYKMNFITVGTTDTIKTGFTWNEANKNIEYSLPAALKNNTVYKVEFWSFNKSGAMIQSNVLNQLKTQSSMSVTNIKGVTAKETKIISAAIKIQKPIYVMYFRTSQFNSLTDKINAMGSWSAGKKNNSIVISNDAIATEHFDEFETKGFQAPDGTLYPALINLDIPWDNNKQNDKFANDNIYANAFMMNLKLVTTDFGVNWIRDYRKPLKTFDLKGIYADKPLNATETGEPVPVSNAPKVSSGGGFMMMLPMSNTTKNASQSFSFGYQSIIWDREKYLLEDFKLMKDFANSVSLNAGAFYGWSSSYTENYLSKLGGNIDFAYNSLGGDINMPWNKFYYLFTDPNYMQIINSLKSMQFTAYPKGNRTLRFSYKAGDMQSNSSVNKIFSY